MTQSTGLVTVLPVGWVPTAIQLVKRAILGRSALKNVPVTIVVQSVTTSRETAHYWKQLL